MAVFCQVRVDRSDGFWLNKEKRSFYKVLKKGENKMITLLGGLLAGITLALLYWGITWPLIIAAGAALGVGVVVLGGLLCLARMDTRPWLIP